MSDGQKGPAPPEILEERDRTILRFGSTEVIQTKDSITLTVHGADAVVTAH